jgi:serine/threonine protein kinase
MIATLRHRTGDEIQNRYLVLDELGAGAFGTVYRCRDRELGLMVAVKELHVLDDPATAHDERALALDQFRREAIHLSELRHAHIVSGHYQPHSATWLVCPTCGYAFRGVATCPEHNTRPVVLKQRHYLVMEYVGGPDLENAAAQTGGILRTEVAVRMASQVADALAHIHEQGWVHRDIKPENIRLRALATNSPAPKSAGLAAGLNAVLLDFGIATESGAEGQFSTRPQKKTTGGGTWGYAPDDPRERLHPDARSDIHALGMTLYHVLSGRDPTEAANLIEMRNSRPIVFNPRMPPALDELIVRCISSDANQRPATAREIASALAEIESPGTSGALPRHHKYFERYCKRGRRCASSRCAVGTGGTVYFCERRNRQQPDAVGQAVRGAPRTRRANTFSTATLPPGCAPRVASTKRSAPEEIRAQYAAQKRQGLEAFIQFTGILPPPTLKVAPESLDFGTLWMGQKRAIDLRIENPGRGHLFGMARTRYSNLSFPATFDGNSNLLKVVLDSRGLARGTYEGDVEIDSSGGEVRLAVSLSRYSGVARQFRSGTSSGRVYAAG